MTGYDWTEEERESNLETLDRAMITFGPGLAHCETCGADTGDPCVTRTGREASDYHAARKKASLDLLDQVGYTDRNP